MAVISELARALAAIARTRGDITTAAQMTAARYGEGSKAALFIRSVIDTGTLSPDAGAFGDFIAGAPSQSIIAAIDRVSPFRRAAPGVPVLVDLTPPVAAWRAEGAPIVNTSIGFRTVRLTGDRSIAGIAVYTVESGRELGDTFVRQLTDDTAAAINYAESSALLDPTNDGTGTAPASLAYGAVMVESSGNTGEAIRADLNILLGQYGGDVSRSVWAVSAATAARLALLGASLGDSDVNASGGFLAGLPLCAARGVPDSQITLLDPSGIVLFDDSARFDTSGETMLNTTNEAGDNEIITLWQANLGATRFTRVLDWEAARPNCVATLTGIVWTPAPTPPTT